MRSVIVFLSLVGFLAVEGAYGQPLWRFDKLAVPGAEEIDVKLERIDAAAARLEVHLPQPDGTVRQLFFDRDYLEQRAGGGLLWIGSATGGERLSLTLEEGLIFAGVHTERGLFSVAPRAHGAPGQHVLETPLSKSRTGLPCGTEAAYSAATPALEPAQLEAALLEAGDKAQPEIDVLVLYSPQALQAYGLSGVVGWARRAMDLNNDAFRTSQMPARLRLVGVRRANFQETPSGFDAINWLRNNPQPRSLRDELGADVVTMIVLNAEDLCGVAATIPSGNIGAFRDQMFQVTRISCIENHTFSHEMGHLFGMEHDPVNGRPPAFASFPWSYGHFVDGRFRTVMSYRTECQLGCTRQPYYSSPQLSYQGEPTGIAGARDNRRTGLAITPIIAGFRQPVSGEPPQAPGSLQASAPSAFRVELTWSDNASNETSYAIERRLSQNATFVAIASVPADTTSFIDDTVDALSSYDYRVRAQNAFGSSAYSATVTVVTPAPDTSSCETDDSVVCLLGGRFEVRVDWSDFDGNSGSGRVLEGFSDQSAIFWFFSQENWEMMVKMVDACTFNDHFWIFSAATTNVEYTLEVRDTETGRQKIYTNPLGTSAAAVTDTAALATCQ